MGQKQKILNYYNATRVDYRALWTGRSDRAIHFGYYDNIAKNHRSALLRMNEVLAESVKITESDRVVDAGCGYGGSAMWLAEHFGCAVTGITLVPMQVSKGVEYIKERNLQSKVNIVEMDYENTTFENGSFTVYWGLESLVHSEDRQKVFNEAFRILNSGGRIVVAEYTLRGSPPLSEAEKEYLRPWTSGWVMPNLLTNDELITGLRTAGFKDVVTRDVTEHVKPSIRRLEILGALIFPIAILIAPIFFKKERLENYYASWRQVNALKKGLWRYSIITAVKG